MQKYIGLIKKKKNYFFVVVKDNESRYFEKIGFFSMSSKKHKMFCINSYRLVFGLIKELN